MNAAPANTTSLSASAAHKQSSGHWRCRACRSRRSRSWPMARNGPPPPAATKMPGRKIVASRLSISTEAEKAMRFGLGLVAVVSMLVGCATNPKEDPVQLRLDDLDARVGRIDRIVSNQSLIQLSQQQDALRTEIRG